MVKINFESLGNKSNLLKLSTNIEVNRHSFYKTIITNTSGLSRRRTLRGSDFAIYKNNKFYKITREISENGQQIIIITNK